MTSEVTVPEAASNAAWEAYKNTGLMSAALAAALPHLSTAIRDAAMEEAAKIVAARIPLYSLPQHLALKECISSIRTVKGKSIPAPTNAALETVAVPKAALDWLMGAGPDPAGVWFGDFPEDHPQPPGAFWWRTTFKEICAYASSIPAPAEGNEAGAPAPAQAPGELVERLALAEMILAHTEDPALAPVAAALSAAIAALSQEQRGAVEIKPLEWEDADEGLCTKWRAAALGGNYELVAFDGEVGFAVNFYWGRPLSFWFIQGKPDEWGPTGPQMFPTLDVAKAAAQADYEARVMSALAATPVHQEAGE